MKSSFWNLDLYIEGKKWDNLLVKDEQKLGAYDNTISFSIWIKIMENTTNTDFQKAPSSTSSRNLRPLSS